MLRSLVGSEMCIRDSQYITVANNSSLGKFSFLIGGGLSLSSTSYKSSDIALRELWSNTVSPSRIYSGRALVGYMANKNLTISLGVAYKGLIEKFDFDGTYITDLEGNVVSELVKDELGITSVNFNSESINADYYLRVERKISAYNHLKTIDLPIQLTYALNDYWLRPNIYAGILINLSNSISGYYYDQKGIPQQYSRDVILKEGNRLYLGAAIEFKLSNRIVLLPSIEFSYQKYSLGDLTMLYSTIGSDLSLKYLF